MASIAAFPDVSRGHVRVEVDSSALTGVRKAWITRTVGGVTSPIREGNPARLSGGKAVLYDTECPLDKGITYNSRTALNRNGDFEDDLYEWSNARIQGCTIAQSFDFRAPSKSRASMKITPVGGFSQVWAFSELVPATPGQVISIEGQVMLSDYWSAGVFLTLFAYNASSVMISGIDGPVNTTPIPGTWESSVYSYSATTPALTAYVALGVVINGSPPPTLGVYADELYLTSSPSSFAVSGTVVVQSNGGGWLKDVLHPAANLRLLADVDPLCAGSGTHFLGFGDVTRPADAASNEVPSSTYGVGTWGVRKARRSSLALATRTDADRAGAEAALASGAPLLVQTPPEFGETDHYALVDDAQWGRLASDQRLPWRVVQLPYAEQPAPVGPAEGVLGVRYVDLDLYNTYAQYNTAGLTWFDVMQGEGT